MRDNAQPGRYYERFYRQAADNDSVIYGLQAFLGVLMGSLVVVLPATGIGTLIDHRTVPDGYESVEELENVIEKNTAIIDNYPVFQDEAIETNETLEQYSETCLTLLEPYVHGGRLSDMEESDKVSDLQSLDSKPCGTSAPDLRIALRDYDDYITAQENKDIYSSEEYNDALRVIDDQVEALQAEYDAVGDVRGGVIGSSILGGLLLSHLGATFVSSKRYKKHRKTHRTDIW